MTIHERCAQALEPLPSAERLRLAALILNDIPSRAVVDYSEEWSEEDLADFSTASWVHLNRSLGEQVP